MTPKPKTIKEAVMELKERTREVHNIGKCKCCDNFMRILEMKDNLFRERLRKMLKQYNISPSDVNPKLTLNREQFIKFFFGNQKIEELKKEL